jgi:type VI protein secretion system component VasK
MLFFLLLLALIVPFLVIGLLFNFSPSTIFVIFAVLVVVWLVNRSYREWKRKQDEQRGETEHMSPQKTLEPESVSMSEPAKIKCPYCGNAYSAKDDVCPYCGGRKPLQEQP